MKANYISETKMKLVPITGQEDRNHNMFAPEECRQLLAMYEDFYPKTGFLMPWVGYFVMKDGKIVGSCGFVGQAKNGILEIAYWTFKEFEGQGIASFACKELLDIAHRNDPTLTITAKTAPEPGASTKILENNHFVLSETVQDEEIGDAWLWTYIGMNDLNK